jgi:hypothetical protein
MCLARRRLSRKSCIDQMSEFRPPVRSKAPFSQNLDPLAVHPTAVLGKQRGNHRTYAASARLPPVTIATLAIGMFRSLDRLILSQDTLNPPSSTCAVCVDSKDRRRSVYRTAASQREL